MPAAFVAVRKFARAALLRGAGLFAALLFAAGFVGGVAGEGLGAGNVAHAQVPDAPQNFTATPGPGVIVLAWTQNSNNVSRGVTAYIAYVNNSPFVTVIGGDTRAITLTGLPTPPPTPYSNRHALWVRAKNANGLGAQSGAALAAQGAATAPSAPSASGAPTPDGVSPANVTLSWSAPAANGSPITAYLLSYGGTVSETLPASQTATVIGVSLGVAYRFTLRAANAIGNSPAAVVAASIAPPVTAPSAVQNFAVTAGDRLFVVTWDPPSDWGNSQLSAYIVSMGILNNFDVYTVANAAITLTTHSYHADGVLNPSDTYKIQVVPRSQAGLTGPMVELVRAPGQSPDAPNVTTSAPASGTQLSVSWSAANADSHNTAATAYAVRLGAVNATLGSGTTATIIGNLQGNTAYTLSVWGISPIGAGAARVITATTAISPAPGEPRNFTLVSRDVRTGLVLAWDEPSSWAGSSLSVYRLQFRLESGSWDTHETTDTRHTITTYLDSSLGPWVGAASQVEFRILARSHAGSNSQLVNLDVPQEVVSSPNAPIVTATALAGGTQISVGWSPANNSGHNTGATAYALRLGAVSVEIASATTATIIGGLQGNTAYTLSVWGISPIGAGAARVSIINTPAAATAPSVSFATVTALASGSEISVSLSVDDGGSSLTGLTLLYGGTAALSLSPTTRAAVIASLSANTAYTLSLVAVNSVGAATAVATATTPAVAPPPITNPTPPRNVSVAEMGADYVVFAWDEPASWGGSSLSIYIFWYQRGSDSWSGGLSTSDNRLTLDSDLGAGESYKAHVFARSAANRNSGFLGQLIGNSITPLLSFVFTPPPVTAPDAPTVNVVTTPVGEAAATVALSWSAPANGGSAITGYILGYGTVSANLPASQTATAIGVSLGVAYSFTLQAANSVGASPAAVVSASIAASFTNPSDVRNIVAVTGSLSFVLSWDEPADWGNSTLSIYRIGWRDGNDNTHIVETADNKVTLSTHHHGAPSHSPLVAGNNYYMLIGARSQANLDSSYIRFPASGFLVATAIAAPSVSFATVTALTSGTEISISLLVDDGGGLSGLTLLYGGTEELSLPPATRATVITGLSANTAYTLSIVAVNAVGAATAVATATTPSAPPSAVQNLSLVSSDARIGFVFSWDAPASWGGSTLSVYRLSLNIASNDWQGYETTDTRITITRYGGSALHLWESSPFFWARVIARSQAGLDSSHVQLNGGAVASSPNAPIVAATALAGGTEISVNWRKANNSANNNNATAYAVHLGTVAATLGSAITATVVGGLQGNTGYTLSVWAINAVGMGGVRVLTLTTAATAPSAPVLAAAATPAGATPSQVTLSWSVADNGGSAITAYILSYGTVSANLPASQTATVIGVSFDVAYSFTLQAANAIGASPATVVNASIAENITPPDTPPNAPRLSLAVLGNGFGVNVSLSWSVSESADNRVEYFVLSYNGNRHTLAASVTSTVVAGLTRGQSYAFALHAVNAAGNSQTARATATIRLIAPLPPANLRATAGDKTLTFEWSAPASWGGSEETGESTLQHYVVHFYDSAASVLHTAAITATQITISQSEGLSVSLANGQQYGFSVAVVNEAGATSEFSALSNVRPRGVGQDAAPDAVVLQAAAGAFSRAFSTPINDRLLAIDGGGNAASAGFMGANFAGAGGAERGIAQLLKRHGNAIANGGNFDSAALRNGSFVMPLGNGGGNAGAGAMGLAKSDILSDLAGIVDRLTDWLGKAGGGAGDMLNNAAVWGGASYRGVENNKNADKWEGNSASYYLGIDSAVGEANENGGVLAGVVFAHNRFKSDYKLANNGGEGEYNVAANSAHPYLLWRSANGKNRAWGSFGFGVGNVERKGAAGDASDRDAKVGGGSAGFRGAVWQRKGVAIDAQADWSFANINIDGGAAARANNLRALLEARGSVAMAGGGFGSPFAQLGYVRQADDANNGAGWEAAAGWRWRGAGGWSGELRGGAADISNGNKEWSAGGVLRKAAANSKGFSMSLRPQYGDAGGSNIAGGGDFWSMPVAKESANPRLGINAKLGYGFTAANALWKPYLSANTAAGSSAAYGAGAAWQNLLQSNLALRAAVQAQRQEQATALQLRFTATY